MRFDSQFNIGDKVWAADVRYLRVHQLTVGKISISHTDSKGRPREELFDNFKPQKKYEERYMCEETGVGSGTSWEPGFNLFATEEEALKLINTLTKLEI